MHRAAQPAQYLINLPPRHKVTKICGVVFAESNRHSTKPGWQKCSLEWIEKVGKLWDSSTMTLTADKKGRLCCRQLFKPMASFEAIRQKDGSILIRELVPIEPECEVLDVDSVDPNTLLPLDGSKIVPESIVAAIRADRDGLN